VIETLVQPPEFGAIEESTRSKWLVSYLAHGGSFFSKWYDKGVVYVSAETEERAVGMAKVFVEQSLKLGKGKYSFQSKARKIADGWAYLAR